MNYYYSFLCNTPDNLVILFITGLSTANNCFYTKLCKLLDK